MSISTLSNESLIKLKSIYSKINSAAGIVGFLVAVGGLVINLITEFKKDVNLTVCAIISIIIAVIALIAIVLMIISWAMLRKIEKRLKALDVQTTEEEQKTENEQN